MYRLSLHLRYRSSILFGNVQLEYVLLKSVFLIFDVVVFIVIGGNIFFTILRFLAKEIFKLLRRYFSCDDISFYLAMVSTHISTGLLCCILLSEMYIREVSIRLSQVSFACWLCLSTNCQREQSQLALMCSFSQCPRWWLVYFQVGILQEGVNQIELDFHVNLSQYPG